MTNQFQNLVLSSESDVEQKFVYKLLTSLEPDGLGFDEPSIKTKVDIRSLAIDKGVKQKLYFPDYAIVLDGLPMLIIEAKRPGEDLKEATREARLYATEINASYPKNFNPCEIIIATDGNKVIGCFWDESDPFVELQKEDLESINTNFAKLLSIASKKNLKTKVDGYLSGIRSNTKYFKPIFMLGGKSVMNETVGDNSFGANVSIEYKYLFNPETIRDRTSVVKNAYVTSKRKQAHVAPIDKIIRAALPKHVVDARPISDSSRPEEILDELNNLDRIKNEICLLIGSVGSGKSTFTDYLRQIALPENITENTQWININLNRAPLSKELIYQWIIDQAICALAEAFPRIDLGELNNLRKIYSAELAKVEKGKAALYQKNSEKYTDIIFNEIDRLQQDKVATFKGIINFLLKPANKLLVVVLDNCDKRNRDDQLLMFEVATWLKSEFPCMVFLPIRDTTYDQYREEPPLDTVIKDLVFRIDPPLLERVIYARLNYALREIKVQSNKFVFHLPNGMKVECDRSEVADYLKTMISSLFQDNLFKRIITGLAGRNIRKGLEILLDFCKSGHIGADEILRIKTSNGEYKLPSHLIAKILLKGKRKFYSDKESHIKNLFDSDSDDLLPDPFVRVAILNWLKDHKNIAGPNNTKGFHTVGTLLGTLQGLGHSSSRILEEIVVLANAGCVIAENQHSEMSENDLISIAPAGFIHLDLLKNINYLSTIAEDVLFRENQIARSIIDNVIGNGNFKSDSRQTAVLNSKKLVDYLASYHRNFFVGGAKILNEQNNFDLVRIDELVKYVSQVVDNDEQIRNVSKLESEYPPGTQVDAQIVSLQEYGFFVEFGLNGTGLIHKSQLAHGVQSIDDFESGDWVLVEIVCYNSVRKKFDLKLIK